MLLFVYLYCVAGWAFVLSGEPRGVLIEWCLRANELWSVKRTDGYLHLLTEFVLRSVCGSKEGARNIECCTSAVRLIYITVRELLNL